jgi:hypothetical protein
MQLLTNLTGGGEHALPLSSPAISLMSGAGQIRGELREVADVTADIAVTVLN